MRKGLVSVVLLTTALVLGSAALAFAGRGGQGPQGWHGAGQLVGSGHPGFRGSPGGVPHPVRHGEFRGPGVVPHRPFFHDRFRRHAEFRTRVFIGSAFWWPDPWWWWGPAYPYYVAPPVVIQQAPPVYIQQGQPPAYWYYCPNPAGYYPYITECPAGWLTVVPPPTAPPGQ